MKWFWVKPHSAQIEADEKIKDSRAKMNGAFERLKEAVADKELSEQLDNTLKGLK